MLPPEIAWPAALPSLKTFDQPLRELRELLVLARPREDLERLDAGRHGQGVATESTSLVHGAGGRDLLHDVPAAAVGADGQAAANHFAHGGDVGRHAEVLLGAAVVDAETGHDLVEHQQSAVLRRHRSEALEEFLRGRDEAAVAHHRFQDDGSTFMLLEQSFYTLKVVVLRN